MQPATVTEREAVSNPECLAPSLSQNLLNFAMTFQHGLGKSHTTAGRIFVSGIGEQQFHYLRTSVLI